MELRIISPLEQKKFGITWLEINTPAGNFVIQSDHAPTVLVLEPGKKMTFCLDNGKQESIMVTQGVVEITREYAMVLLS